MYDVLFIDDKFEEIKDTFFALQKEHVRCFYSDGDKYMPQTAKKRLPFKNLKYICLDFYLENLGINESSNKKTATSALANAIREFIIQNKKITIIVNTAYSEDFENVKNDFIKYLKLKEPPKIIIESKKDNGNTAKFSILHNKESIKKDICQASHNSTLRNLVIREAINIENKIFKNIRDKFYKIANNLTTKQLEQIKKFDFSAKITLFGLINNNKELLKKLNELRRLRNEFAHKKELSKSLLLIFLEKDTKSDISEQCIFDFLKKIKDLEEEINRLN